MRRLTGHRRSVLEIVLGGVFGALLGGILTVALVLVGIGNWVIWVPVVAGAAVGLWQGDRGLFGLMRLAGFLS